MKLRLEQLHYQLQRKLAPIYLVATDELLLQQEAVTAIRTQAQQQGYLDALSIDRDGKVAWQDLLSIAQSHSLFGHKQLLLLHIADGKPAQAGAQALQRYTEQLPSDKLLLITTPRLDSAAQKSRWFSRIDAVGNTLVLWPIAPHELPQWITRRLATQGLTTDSEGLELLIARTEGNLLAAAQEIEKLALLYTQGQISATDIANAVTDNAHFSIFALIDACLLGDAERCQHILHHLRAAGEPNVLVLWAVCRCLRQLIQLTHTAQTTHELTAAMRKQGIWQQQQSLYQRVLATQPVTHWYELLRYAAYIDRVCKGAASGNPWDLLLQLCLAFSTQATLLTLGPRR